MIINNAPVNEAVLSNVGEIGEFKIRNSAKAFSILSSGLYANKIRAIIRELSCNAVDAHVAAGNANTPFDVHLPSQLEPWFSIRDYGTGLSHDQVTQIYTTYFESTKTGSNDFIGALGLGSKSPFSYTDNFTVTAIQNGEKGIYSAFINEAGVPSIAKMMSEATDEPNGVEVKFSVNDYWDNSKFADEARQVYTYFKLRPVITGREFDFHDVTYKTENIIPGVHHTDSYHSKAVMGNIAYPIDVPNPETNLDGLHQLLGCGLEMHFEIGELDFQASREGLSYIPQTIASIKRKLEELNAKLAVFIADEADKIDNTWERAMFLDEKKNDRLWQKAVEKYVADTGFKLFTNTAHYGLSLQPIKVKVEDLATRYNIHIRAFNKNRGYSTVTNASPNNDRDPVKKDANGYALYVSTWYFPVSKGARFVITDTKVGANNRARAAYREITHNRDEPYTYNVFVLEPVDKTKPMNVKALKRILCNPPAEYFTNASDLPELERTSSGRKGNKNVTIMKMEERGTGGYYRRDEMVWREAGKADDFDNKTTYYYIPMSGYAIEADILKGHSANSIHQIMHDSGIASLKVDIYGVRKGDIEAIKTKKNWVNIEEFAKKELNKLTDAQLKTLAMSMIDNQRLVRYNDTVVKHITNKKSPYLVASLNVKNSTKIEMSRSSLEALCKAFDVTVDVQQHIDEIAKEHSAIYDRYPLLNCLSSYHGNDEAVAEYINAMDVMKK